MTEEPLDRLASLTMLRGVLKEVQLPIADAEQVLVLLSAGELQVALETLCIQAYEYDVGVPLKQRETLERLGRALGVPVGYLLGDPWAAAPGCRRPL